MKGEGWRESGKRKLTENDDNNFESVLFRSDDDAGESGLCRSEEERALTS